MTSVALVGTAVGLIALNAAWPALWRRLRAVRVVLAAELAGIRRRWTEVPARDRSRDRCPYDPPPPRHTGDRGA